MKTLYRYRGRRMARPLLGRCFEYGTTTQMTRHTPLHRPPNEKRALWPGRLHTTIPPKVKRASVTRGLCSVVSSVIWRVVRDITTVPGHVRSPCCSCQVLVFTCPVDSASPVLTGYFFFTFHNTDYYWFGKLQVLQGKRCHGNLQLIVSTSLGLGNKKIWKL